MHCLNCSHNFHQWVLVAQSCLTLCDPMDCTPPGSSVHEIFPGKNTGAGCHSLLQGNFPTQGLNPGLPHCRQILYHLSHQEMSANSLTLCRNKIHSQSTNIAKNDGKVIIIILTFKTSKIPSSFLSNYSASHHHQTPHNIHTLLSHTPKQLIDLTPKVCTYDMCVYMIFDM